MLVVPAEAIASSFRWRPESSSSFVVTTNRHAVIPAKAGIHLLLLW